MAYKQKGWNPFTKVEPKPIEVSKLHGLEEPKKKRKKRRDLNEVGSEGSSEAQSWTLSHEPGGYAHASWSPLMKNGDDDTGEMTKKERRRHRKKVLKYNKKVANPLNETQKARILEQLKTMDPKDPEAKLLRKMLNLKKNK